jgi:hypothetical protein
MAFFIGDTAAKIIRFDERTWQSGFASRERSDALRKMSDETVKAAFTNLTMNPELRTVLALRFQPRRPAAAAASGSLATAVPCLFNVQTTAAEDQFPPKASEELKELFRARAAVWRSGTDCTEAVQTIRRILVGQLAASATKPLDKSGAHFAGVAARACIINKQFEGAKEMLELGFKFFQDEPELAYLSRLLEREAGGQGSGSLLTENAGRDTRHHPF